MIKRVLLVALIIIIDLFLYLFLGLMMMNYEDFYTPEDGPWYSLESMTTQEMLIWFAYHGWFVLNSIILIFLTYKWIKKKRKTTAQHGI